MGVRKVYFIPFGLEQDLFRLLKNWVSHLEDSFKLGNWIHTKIYLHNPTTKQQTSPLYIVNFDKEEDKQFEYYVLKNQVLEADINFRELVTKLNRFQFRQGASILGEVYEIGTDILLRIGELSIGVDRKGFLLDIECKSCNSENQCTEIFEDLVANLKNYIDSLGLFGFVQHENEKSSFQIMDAKIDYGKYGLGDETFSNRHVALQYVLLLQQMKLL